MRADDPHSGEAFREDVLLPALRRAERQGDVVTVSLDDIAWMSPSFLDEAFAGIARRRVYSPARLRELMRVESSSPIHNPFHIDLIWQWVDEAGAQ